MSEKKLINFESSWKKADQRERIRDARDRVLQDAEVKAVRRADRRQKEESWILPELDQEFSSSKKDKKSKKKKKEKKKKKTKKSRRESSGSESTEGSENEWEEKKTQPTVQVSREDVLPVRDDWMGLISSGSLSNRDVRGNREETKRLERAKREESEVLEQNKRELNPAITHKAGGEAACDDRRSTNKHVSGGVCGGDGGAAWLKRAFKRAQEQADREGKTIDEIATQRWGSLEKFKVMLARAEGREPRNRRSRSRSRDRKRSRSRSRDRRRSRSRSRDRRRSRSRSRDRKNTKERQKFHRPSEQEIKHRYSRNRRNDRDSRGWKKSQTAESCSMEKMRSSSEKSPKKRRHSSSGSSERSKSPETQPEVKEEERVVLTEKEMNVLGAKLIKAEMLGNVDLVEKLKAKLEAARETKQQMEEEGGQGVQEEVVVLTRTDGKGMSRPVDANVTDEQVKGRRKKEKVQTHAKGERMRYFADDDKYDLKQMYEREKLSTAEDQNSMLSRLAGKAMEKANEDYDLDDMITDKAATKRSEEADKKRDRDKAIAEHRQLQRQLDDCKFCFGTKHLQKHLLVAVGKSCYLTLPHHTPLAEGHCFIVPMNHATCGTLLDEDIHAEIQQFRKALTKMFEDDDDQDCVFYETALRLKRHPHMILECVPLPREIGNEAPMYFQKAIQECEQEWSHNQKLVKLTNEKGLRRSIPKGLPYFHVDFGLQNGFAHVVEDEAYFPSNFAQEILGGMLDVEPRVYKNPKRENFDTQKQRVLRFGAKWKDYDFTKKTRRRESSDSE